LNERKEKKEEKIKREVRRIGRNVKKFFTEPTFFTTLIIIMMAFNQGAKDISLDAYTRGAPQIQPGQIIFSMPTSSLTWTRASQSKPSKPSSTPWTIWDVATTKTARGGRTNAMRQTIPNWRSSSSATDN
jgi:hypothetical protein